jgi:crossover junction endodeoxyribonuclease RuvC
MKILALDLGNKMGYALSNDGVISSGTIKHKNTKSLVGHQYLHFRYWLGNVLFSFDSLDVIYYEDVRRHLGTDAAHVYGGYLATLQAFCCEKTIKLVPVAVGTIKKHWTGKGNANKYEMIKEARQRGFEPADDNEADALAILDYAKTHVNK